jgi:hypothetical protein
MKPFNEFNRGDAFNGTVWYAPRENQPSNLIGYSGTSMILDSAGNRHSGQCTIAPDGLSVLVLFPSTVTKDFALGIANWNVKFQFGNDTTTTFSTKTWQFKVKEAPTL